jgi:hypothetical protein
MLNVCRVRADTDFIETAIRFFVNELGYDFLNQPSVKGRHGHAIRLELSLSLPQNAFACA